MIGCLNLNKKRGLRGWGKEFLVVFSGRLGVRLREDWRETRRKTEGGLGEGFESQIINSTSLNSVERFHKACAIQ